MTRFVSIFFVLACCCWQGRAQEYRAFARRYSIEEGLPHRQVNKILQDRRGFIWAATNGGVTRFDGRQFKIINKASGLGSDLVEWVVEDAKGYIWACRTGPNGWLAILDPLTGSVVPTANYFRQWPIPVPPARWWKAPLTMADGSLLVSVLHPGDLWRFHPQFGWSRIPLPDCTSFMLLQSGARQTIWGLLAPADNSGIALLEIDVQGKVQQRITPRPGWTFWEKRGTADQTDHFFVLEHKTGETPVLWEFNAEGQRRPAPLWVNDPFVRQHGRLANSRIEVQFPQILDPHGKPLLDISRQYPEIDPAQYRDYLVDHNGKLWFATTFGLVVVEVRKNYFRRLLYDPNAPGGRGLACRGLLEKNGQLLVNLEPYGQGRVRVDPASGSAERLPGRCAIGIAPAADGNVWTECIMGDHAWQTLSLFKATPAGQLTGQQLLQKKDFGYIWTILEEHPQRVLLGHSHGITVYNPLDGTAEPWHDAQTTALEHANVSWLGRDRAGQTWACTEQGLFLLKPGGGVAAHYWTGGTGAYQLPFDHIYYFYEDAAGIFWLGTSGGGLIRWDRKAPPGQQTRVVFRENGLLNGVVYAVYEDQHQHLWLPTDYGIVQLDKKSLQVRHTWLTGDGLTHNEFNRVSHCQGADGTLYFGGLNGITAFHPDDFYQQSNSGKTKLPLAISAFSILKSGHNQLENHTPELLRSNQITLHPDDRYVQLEFALLDYFAPEKATYTWKLEGLANHWETLKEPVLRLSGLPFGTHPLRIRAQAADGAMATNELYLKLRVLPPFYLSGWFFGLVALLLAVSIWLWLRWRIREHRREQERLEEEVDRQTNTIRQQTEELQQLDRLKSRFFANVSHELRTPLTLLLGPIEYALNDIGLSRKSKSLLQTAQRNSLQLQNLVNEILDLSKLRATGLELQEQATVLFDFLEEILSSFQSLAEHRAIALRLEYQPAPGWTLALDRHKLLKILGNLLSNALKYAPGGSAVVLQVEAQAGEVLFRVQDAGPGIHPEDLPHIFDLYFQSKRPESQPEGGTGIGLALARELAQAMGGGVWAESTPGAGTVFFLRLPARECSPETAAPIAWGQRHTGRLDAPEKPPPAQAARGDATARLLVVEDNPDLQAFLRTILPADYQLTLVDNGRAALDYLSAAETPPDLILSDVMMPEMDGFQLLETLRQSKAWRQIPVLLLTALAGPDDRLRAFRIGVDDYITKPFSAEELTVRIENALRNLLARREWLETESAAPDEAAEQADIWLQRLREIALLNLGNPQFNVNDLAERMGVSRKTLYRQIRLRAGLSANQLIQELRLLQARELIESGEYRTLRQVADAVGMRSADYLSRLYRERFGKSPAADL
ncbi:MAG: response regulator [Saprospiraceae bacterium]|nr:response regulator [Saprospiraceae bacterium]